MSDINLDAHNTNPNWLKLGQVAQGKKTKKVTMNSIVQKPFRMKILLCYGPLHMRYYAAISIHVEKRNLQDPKKKAQRFTKDLLYRPESPMHPFNVTCPKLWHYLLR